MDEIRNTLSGPSYLLSHCTLTIPYGQEKKGYRLLRANRLSEDAVQPPLVNEVMHNQLIFQRADVKF